MEEMRREDLKMLTWYNAVKKPVEIKFCIADKIFKIHTEEGTMTANKGDVIIEGVNKELYPCKKEIFIKTYEVMEKVWEKE